MKPPVFSYARPDTLAEAIDLLARYGDEVSVLAGGQSLMPMLALRVAAPAILVDINRVAELQPDATSARNGGFAFGALVRHRAALAEVTARDPAHLLARYLPHVAHPAIRNRGTVCGSLALADPAAELPACVVCLDAEIELAGPSGRRTVLAAAFFEGLYATARAPDELVTAVRFPPVAPGTRMAFAEVARCHGDYAILGLAASARVVDGRLRDCRLVYFGAADCPVRAPAVEALLDDGAPVQVAGAAAEAAWRTLEVADDPTYGEPYKRHLAGVLVARVLPQLESGQ